MQVVGIHRDLLRLLLALGRDAHPSEFVALLRERDGILEELEILPGTVSGSESASLQMDMLPLGLHPAGSAHSHPNGVLEPSDADLRFFPKTGRYHIIVGFPYRTNDWRAYTADGAPCRLEVVA